MITIFAVLEEGYESSFEHLAYRQLKNAYGVELVTVPHNYPTTEEALSSLGGTKVFMIPPGRLETSTEFKDWEFPHGQDVVFCFGSPQVDLVKQVGSSQSLKITTPNPAVDMMGVCVAGIVLHVHRQ